MSIYEIKVDSEQETKNLGIILAEQLSDITQQPTILYLSGDLGVGKTTFVRALVNGFGHTGNVKSPTYTLVEPYELVKKNIYHFDLYRLAEPEELNFLGVEEYFNEPGNLCLIEWPEKGRGFFPQAGIRITIEAPTPNAKDLLASKSSIDAERTNDQRVFLLEADREPFIATLDGMYQQYMASYDAK